jgi:hypothetical protein
MAYDLAGIRRRNILGRGIDTKRDTRGKDSNLAVARTTSEDFGGTRPSSSNTYRKYYLRSRPMMIFGYDANNMTKVIGMGDEPSDGGAQIEANGARDEQYLYVSGGIRR